MEGFEVSEDMVTAVADVYLRGRQMGGRRVNAPADLGKLRLRESIMLWHREIWKQNRTCLILGIYQSIYFDIMPFIFFFFDGFFMICMYVFFDAG